MINDEGKYFIEIKKGKILDIKQNVVSISVKIKGIVYEAIVPMFGDINSLNNVFKELKDKTQ